MFWFSMGNGFWLIITVSENARPLMYNGYITKPDSLMSLLAKRERGYSLIRELSKRIPPTRLLSHEKRRTA